MIVPNTENRPWFRVVNMAQTEDGGTRARLDIYDQIGEYFDWINWEPAGVAARDFSTALQALVGVTEIELHINSPGGSVTDGWQIYNELKRHPANVIGYIDGQAASMASVIFQACDERIMPSNTSQWVHDPMAGFDAWVHGNADDMRDIARQALHLADDLDTTGSQLVNVYVQRAAGKLDEASIRAMMKAETLITAEEAVEFGFADRLEDEIQMAACKDAAALNRSAVQAAKQAIEAARQQQQPPAPPKDDANPDQPGPDQPEPVAAMPAADIATACKAAGFAALAVDLIAAGPTPDQVQAKLKLAGEVRDCLAAAGYEHTAPDTITAALDGPLPAIRQVLALRLEQEQPDIRGEHSPGDGRDLAPVIDISDIYQRINSSKAINRR